MTGSRPTSVGHALHRGSAQQLVAAVTGHLAEGAQGAAVVPSTGGVAGHIAIGQAQKVTPSWICIETTLFNHTLEHSAKTSVLQTQLISSDNDFKNSDVGYVDFQFSVSVHLHYDKLIPNVSVVTVWFSLLTPVVQSGSIVLLLWNNLIVAAVQCGSRV